MPFTLSHPAAVLPLLRRPFSATALVAGTIAPDLPYFARSTPIPVGAQSWYEPYLNATTSHGLLGALTVSLPYALALYVACWAARPAVGALVPAVRRRSPGPDGARALATRTGWVLLSLLIGIATHLVWDSFTVARALQHLSTVVGLVLIAGYLLRRRARIANRFATAGPGSRAGARTAFWVAVAAVAVGAILNTLEWWDSSGTPPAQILEGVLAGVAKGGGAALLGALLVYVAAWWAIRGVSALRRR